MIGLAVFALLLGYAQCDLFSLELTTPSVSGCYYQGSYYPVGSFKPTPCEYCQCSISGQAMCAIADCAPPQCADAVHEKDKCCPTCPNGKYGTLRYFHDQYYIFTFDEKTPTSRYNILILKFLCLKINIYFLCIVTIARTNCISYISYL